MYEVPKSKKSLKQNQFEVKIDDQVFTMPLMKFIKPDVLADAESMPQASGSRHLLEAVAPGLFAKFEDTEQVEDFMAAYQKASGITAGESSASSDS